MLVSLIDSFVSLRRSWQSCWHSKYFSSGCDVSILSLNSSSTASTSNGCSLSNLLSRCSWIYLAECRLHSALLPISTPLLRSTHSVLLTTFLNSITNAVSTCCTIMNYSIFWSWLIFSITLCLWVQESGLLNLPELGNVGRSGIVLTVVNKRQNVTTSTSIRVSITRAATIKFYLLNYVCRLAWYVFHSLSFAISVDNPNSKHSGLTHTTPIVLDSILWHTFWSSIFIGWILSISKDVAGCSNYM